MNARKTIAVFAMLALTSAGSAFAAVNNVNSRGQFVPMGSNLNARHSYSRPAYRGQGSRGYVYRAPAIVAAPAPMVASAPTEGRRFSYAPAAPTVTTGTPCPTDAATAPATNGARRFSYAPEASATTTPAPAVTRYYAPRPSYSNRSSGSNVERWLLPKTDPRKYTTH